MQPVSNSVPGVGIEEGMAANEYMEDELSSPWKLCTTSAAQRLIRIDAIQCYSQNLTSEIPRLSDPAFKSIPTRSYT